MTDHASLLQNIQERIEKDLPEGWAEFEMQADYRYMDAAEFKGHIKDAAGEKLKGFGRVGYSDIPGFYKSLEALMRAGMAEDKERNGFVLRLRKGHSPSLKFVVLEPHKD